MTTVHVPPAPTRSSRRRAHPASSSCGLPSAGWRVATVHSVDEDGRIVLGDAPATAARAALGCLVAVQQGDTVAVLSQDGCAWVMSVLARPGPQDLALRSPGALALRGSAIDVQAGEALRMQAPQVALDCEQAQVTGARLNVFGASIKAIGQALSSVFDRAHHHAGQYMRTTQGLDRTQARHVELHASQLLQVHAEHALVEGEKLVKARGAQIHFG
ncbi:DUF3540 domain-containing protein [uncultured Pseudacidovorax sp.]|uniref:DUF3540 domain-containing protein n=1 Tax=uncultured Pseudacidovorax sp. TaxID=679313 RepID=UPI0025E0EB4C|nr:DUF3540 domain-containing protein [uncultured Pseudacidovorax sp.]